MKPSIEYQAVVLAGGKGSRMMDLTTSHIKCLLPIGKFPMIWYSLNMLRRIGFKDVIVVTLECAKAEVINLPKKYNMELSLDVVSISCADSYDDFGTADALRLIHDKLYAHHIMIVSSDLISDVHVHHLTDLHGLHQSSVTVLFTPIHSQSIHVPGPKTNHKKERDLVGIDKREKRLCYLSAEADLEEFVTIQDVMLKEHPHITIYSNLLDAHFYIMDKWVCDLLVVEKRFSTLKGEFLPYLVKKQFSQSLKQTEPPPILSTETMMETPKSSHKRIDRWEVAAQDLSSWNDHSGDLLPAYRNRSLRCYAYIMDDVGSICYRANNIYTYCQLNRIFDRILPAVAPHLELIHPAACIDSKSQISSDCTVGEGSIVAEKTWLKGCVIGAACKIEPKVRLLNSVIMDNVTIHSGCNIQGSLICKEVTVGQNCDVKDCIVGKGQILAEDGQFSAEILVNDDDDVDDDETRMMEI